MLIDLEELSNHPKAYKAHSEYQCVTKMTVTPLCLDTFQTARIVEIKDENYLYLLPVGYSQKHGPNSRQQYYQDIYKSGKYLGYDCSIMLKKEPNNPFDKHAIGFHFILNNNNKILHLGYVPAPLNLLVGKLMDQHVGDIKLIDVAYILLHDKYTAPIFRWDLNIVAQPSQVIRNRFLAILYDND